MVVPFPPSQHICTCKYTCQRLLCLLTWRHQQRVPSHCFGNCDFEGNYLADIVRLRALRGRPGETKNSSRVLLAELGLQKPLAETPKGSVCWEKEVASSRFRCGQAIAVNRRTHRYSVQRILGREYMEEKGLPQGERLQISPPL